MDNLRYLY